jgi:hypothetical protein
MPGHWAETRRARFSSSRIDIRLSDFLEQQRFVLLMYAMG